MRIKYLIQLFFKNNQYNLLKNKTNDHELKKNILLSNNIVLSNEIKNVSQNIYLSENDNKNYNYNEISTIEYNVHNSHSHNSFSFLNDRYHYQFFNSKNLFVKDYLVISKHWRIKHTFSYIIFQYNKNPNDPLYNWINIKPFITLTDHSKINNIILIDKNSQYYQPMLNLANEYKHIFKDNIYITLLTAQYNSISNHIDFIQNNILNKDNIITLKIMKMN